MLCFLFSIRLIWDMKIRVEGLEAYFATKSILSSCSCILKYNAELSTRFCGKTRTYQKHSNFTWSWLLHVFQLTFTAATLFFGALLWSYFWIVTSFYLCNLYFPCSSIHLQPACIFSSCDNQCSWLQLTCK